MNSRGRIPMLERFLRSLNKTKYPDRLDVQIWVDDDDKPTLEFIEQYNKRFFKKKIRWIIQPRSYHLIRNINEMAQATPARFIWALNNDSEIATKNWDVILEKFILENKLENKICYLACKDDMEHPYGFCCFPIQNRLSMERTTALFPNEIHSAGADSILFDIYNQLSEKRLYEVPIQVLHPNKKLPPDEINQEVERMSHRRHLEKYEFKRYVDRLNEGICCGH